MVIREESIDGFQSPMATHANLFQQFFILVQYRCQIGEWVPLECQRKTKQSRSVYRCSQARNVRTC